MAGLNLITMQDTIAAYVEAQFSGYEVYQDYILNDEQLQKVDNRVKPYIVISWDGLSRSQNNAAFAGVRKDEYYSGFSIGVIAPAPRQCREAMNLIFDRLTGYSPDGIVQLSPSGAFGTFVVSEKSGVPHLYMSMADFTFPFNVEDVGSNISP
jgi:hypothetical protein